MAKRYSGKKGRAGSKKPLEEKQKSWLSYGDKEVEQLAVKLAKTGKQTSQIGLILRDNYGIPDAKQITKKPILKILNENGLKPKTPEDLFNLMKREANLRKHITKNNKDMGAKRGLIITHSKIRRLEKYYKRNGILPKEWTLSKQDIKFTA